MGDMHRIKEIDDRNLKAYLQIYKMENFTEKIEPFLIDTQEMAQAEDYIEGLYQASILRASNAMVIGEHDKAYELLDGLDENLLNNQCSAFCRMMYNGELSIYYIECKGDFELSLKYANEELAAAEEMGDMDEVMRIQLNLASTTGEMGYHETSMDLINKCITYFESMNDTLSLAYCYVNLGSAYGDLQDLDKALVAFEKGLLYAEKHDVTPLIYGILFSISQVYREKEAYAVALDVLGRAKELEKDIDRIHDIAERVHQSVRLHMRFENFEEALKEMIFMTKKLDQLENKHALIRFYKDKADLYFKLQSYKEASKALYTYMELKEAEDRRDLNKEISEQVHEVYKKDMDRLDTLARIGRQLTLLTDIDDMLVDLKESLRSLLDVDVIGIGFLEENSINFQHYFVKGEKIDAKSISLYSDSSLAVWCVKNESYVVLNDVNNESSKYVTNFSKRENIEEPLTNSAMYKPLVVGNEIIGVFTVQSERLNAYSSLESKVFNIIADYLATAVNNARQRNRLEQMIVIDSLTGLHNRKGFHDFFEEKTRNKDVSSVAITMLDLDYFKKINDTYGHDVGDKVLVKVATLLGTYESNNVEASRLGGEEFALMAIDLSEEEVVLMAEGIRKSIRSLSINANDHKIGITTSIGIVYKSNLELYKYEQLYHEADQALYQAKRQGRNRIEKYLV